MLLFHLKVSSFILKTSYGVPWSLFIIAGNTWKLAWHLLRTSEFESDPVLPTDISHWAAYARSHLRTSSRNYIRMDDVAVFFTERLKTIPYVLWMEDSVKSYSWSQTVPCFWFYQRCTSWLLSRVIGKAGIQTPPIVVLAPSNDSDSSIAFSPVEEPHNHSILDEDGSSVVV